MLYLLFSQLINIQIVFVIVYTCDCYNVIVQNLAFVLAVYHHDHEQDWQIFKTLGHTDSG